MSDIGGIRGIPGAEPPDRSRRSQSLGEADRTRGSRFQRANDSVEFSQQAINLAKLKDVDEVRTKEIEDIKNQIARGTYNPDAKLDQALDGLLDDIGLEDIR